MGNFYLDTPELKFHLTDPMMKKIAEITQGKYFHAENRAELDRVFNDIGKNLPNITEDKTLTTSINLTPLF